MYGLLVVWAAQDTPDIGLRCAFETQIQGVAAEYLVYSPTGRFPKPGDTLLRIGPREIRSWPDFVRTLDQLEDHEQFPRTPDLGAIPDAELERLPDPSKDVIRRGSDSLVRVEYLPEGEAQRQIVWCRIGTPPLAEFAPSLIWFVVKLGIFLIGAVIYWKRPGDETALRFFALCVVTVGAFMGGYHWLRIVGKPPLVVVFILCAVLLPAVYLHFYLVFPRPKGFLVRRPRLVRLLIYGVPGLFATAMLVTYAIIVATYRAGDRDPGTLETVLRTFLLNEIYIYLVIAAGFFAGCVASLVHSFVTTGPGSIERNQVKWILMGALLATLPIGYTLYLAGADPDAFALGAGTWPMFAASLSITVAYGISMSRYRLLDVDQVLNWGIVYVAISLGAGLVYTGLVFLSTYLSSQQVAAGSALRHAVLGSLTSFLVFIVVELVRWRLRKAIDRRLHREKYQLDKTLRQMSQAVEQMVDPPTLGRRFLHALGELLQLQRGALYLRDGNPPLFRLAAHLGAEPRLRELPPGAPLVDSLGHAPLVQVPARLGAAREPAQSQLALLGGQVAVPLRHERQLMALLLVGPRPGGYDAEELHLLTAFAQVGALALHGAQGHQAIDNLNRDLQVKVEKISEQQRRIAALQNQLLRQSTPGTASPPLSAMATAGIVGSSPTIRQLLEVVRKVAASPSSVLIRGENGTGKELLAQALHDNSPRAGKAFVKVHCAALSTGLLESELFGHVKGAFTGAHRDKVGRFEMADGGTLFLDEIGDISVEVQTKLLRVLQEKTFERVGSSAPVQVDVRLIAATHQNLEELMRAGRFREDLFYRLNVISIRTPPLRERREDICELAFHFLEVYAARNGKVVSHIEDEVLECLKAHDWPGNIRELENVIQRAVVLADGPSVTLRELPPDFVVASDDVAPSTAFTPSAASADGPAGKVVPEDEWSAWHDQRERDRLARALAAAGGNKAEAARALGIPRSTLISKLEKLGLLMPRRRV